MPTSILSVFIPSTGVLVLALGLGLGGCATDRVVAASVVVPCPGTSDPMPAGLPCGLVCRAELPIRQSDSHLFLVDVQVGGKPALLMLDTGSDRTMLSPAAATRLGLPPATGVTERVLTIGGVSESGSTTMRGIAIGQARIDAGPVALMPSVQGAAGTGDLGFDGVLGDDFLSRYQIDLDFHGKKVRLYEGKLCPGSLPGWPAEASIVPFTSNPISKFVGIDVRLNGMPVKSLLDTGVELTIAAAPAVTQLGVFPDQLARDVPVRLLGIGPGGADARLHRFMTLDLGGATVPDPLVAILSGPNLAGPPGQPWMIVGDTVLATRRVWIDYPGRQVHFGRPD